MNIFINSIIISAREGCGSKKPKNLKDKQEISESIALGLAVSELVPCSLTLCAVQMLNYECLSVTNERIQSLLMTLQRGCSLSPKVDASMSEGIHTRPP